MADRRRPGFGRLVGRGVLGRLGGADVGRGRALLTRARGAGERLRLLNRRPAAGHPRPIGVGVAQPLQLARFLGRELGLLAVGRVLHVGTPAQEVLDLPLIAVGLLRAAEDGVQAHVLGERDDRLARRVLVDEPGGLELAVVEPAAEAELAEHLGRDAQAEPAKGGRRESGAPGRQERGPLLAEQVDDLGERQHAVGRHVEDPAQVVPHGMRQGRHDVVLVHELVARVEAQDGGDDREREERRVRRADVRPEHVRETQDRRRDEWVLLAEVADAGLRLDDVALDPGRRRMRPPHRLGEERRVVLRRAVVVRRGLVHELAHARVRARGQDVHGPDHVVLVRLARARGDRVDHQPAVHHGVDLRRLDDPPEQRVLRPHADELGALELAGRVAVVDADDRLDLLVLLERLRESPAPVGGEAGDEHASRHAVAAPNRTRPTCAS